MIKSYGERGVVTALFESIAASAEPVRLLCALLQRCVSVHCTRGHRTPGQRLELNPKYVDGFEIYIEPNLSDFGAPDVVLVVQTPELGLDTAYFIEAKMGTFNQSLGTNPVLQKNASSILHELFLKARFHALARHELLRGPEYKQLLDVEGKRLEALHEGSQIYKHDAKDLRRIGDDEMVLELAQRLGQCACRLVALTADPPLTGIEPFVTRKRIFDHLVKIDEENPHTLDLPAATCDFAEAALHLSWKDVYAWARGEASMERLVTSMHRNLSKFDPGPSIALDGEPELTRFLESCGLNRGQARTHPNDHRLTWSDAEGSVVAVGLYPGVLDEPTIVLNYVGKRRERTLPLSSLLDLTERSPAGIRSLCPQLEWPTDRG